MVYSSIVATLYVQTDICTLSNVHHIVHFCTVALFLVYFKVLCIFLYIVTQLSYSVRVRNFTKHCAAARLIQ